MVGTGTAVNVVAVLVGGGIGTVVGAKLPEAMRRTAMQAMGIVTLLGRDRELPGISYDRYTNSYLDAGNGTV